MVLFAFTNWSPERRLEKKLSVQSEAQRMSLFWIEAICPFRSVEQATVHPQDAAAGGLPRRHSFTGGAQERETRVTVRA